jgi:predicted permease
MSWWSRVVNVFRTGSVERDLDAELQFHVEERIRELTDAGMTREAAAKEVARRFGNPLRLREQSLDIKLLPWLDSLIRDVRLGFRMLRKNAIVTAASVVSLSLALGASVAAFSLVDALILKPLPVRQPGQLVYLAFPTYTPERPEADTFNDPTFVRLRDAGRQQLDLFAMSTQVMRRVTFADAGGEKESVRTQFVSGDAFEKLGIAPYRGRIFVEDDDVHPPSHPVAVLSHAFWTRRFGADPAVLGRWVALDDRQFEIVGITEPRFSGIEPGRPTDVWFPYGTYNPHAFGNADFNWFRILGRMKNGVRWEQAQAVLQTTFTRFRRDRADNYPNQSPDGIRRYTEAPLYVRSAANGPSPLRQQFGRPLWILSMIAALVLLIAGSNVANLFLARTAAREHEMSLRLSIGAGRGRLIQQMLVESALVAAAATATGLLFARVVGPAVVGMLGSAEDPIQLDLGMNWRLAAFAAALTLVTTALFGVAPALRASSVAPMTVLKVGARTGARARVMRPFVAAQVAFGLIVVFVGSLLVLSFARLSSINPGFAASNVLLLSIERVQRLEPDRQRAALLEVLDRLRGVPGVRIVSSSEANVLGRAWTHYIRVPGTEHEAIEATVAPVTPGFIETMNIPLLTGRTFVAADMDPSAASMLVNESFARRYFGREQGLGRTIDVRFDSVDKGPHQIVGIVADTKYDLRKPPAPTVYIPLPARMIGTIHVRVVGDPVVLAARLREEVRAANPWFRVTSVTSQTAAVERTLLRERLLALLSGFFAVVGLVLAAVGLYGVLSYSVVQRTREIGIRVALGARPVRVIGTVVAEIGGAGAMGAALGLAGGLYLSRFVEALLFDVTPLEFWSLALPIGTLVMAGALAAFLPAVRAARVDPVIALRYE